MRTLWESFAKTSATDGSRQSGPSVHVTAGSKGVAVFAAGGLFATMLGRRGQGPGGRADHSSATVGDQPQDLPSRSAAYPDLPGGYPLPSTSNPCRTWGLAARPGSCRIIAGCRPAPSEKGGAECVRCCRRMGRAGTFNRRWDSLRNLGHSARRDVMHWPRPPWRRPECGDETPCVNLPPVRQRWRRVVRKEGGRAEPFRVG
jgi:hypothetical protein